MITPRQHNFVYLLAGLMILVLAVPLFRDLIGTEYPGLSEVAFSLFLIVGIWSLRGAHRWLFYTALVLAILGVAGNLMSLADFGVGFVYLSLCGYIASLFIAISLAALQVFRSSSVDLNNIVGAVCIYLLLGLIGALVYLFVNLLVPDSFAGQISGNAYHQLQELVYFSLVTLTSLGYGDLTPTGATVRALATLEVMFGQFYIAILVSIYIQHRAPD